MATPWRQILIDALAETDVVSVGEVVRRHLRREPTRSEISAARRAARMYADAGKAVTVMATSDSGAGGKRDVLLLARPDADLADEKRLRDVASRRRWKAARTSRAPRDETQVVDRLIRRAGSAALAATRVDVDRLEPEAAGDFARDLYGSIQELHRLRRRLLRRRGY